MKTIVLKFGGSSLGTKETLAEGLLRLQKIVSFHQELGMSVVLVVSALSGRTREIKSFGFAMGLRENTEELDSLLAIGEEESASIVAGYLKEKCGLKTRLLIRENLPIKTDENFGDAKVTEVETKLALEALKKGEVVVVPGFIGSFNGVTTTLGLDGSDATAVALAKAFGSEVCAFYKDVYGIYTANPRRVALAKKIDELSFEEMFVFSQLGARVLHPKAINLAKGTSMKLKICPYFLGGEGGSLVSESIPSKDITGITYLEHKNGLITLSVVGKSIRHDKELESVVKTLAESYILAKEHKTGFENMSVTVSIYWKEQVDIALKLLHHHYGLDAPLSDEQAYLGNGKQVYDPGMQGNLGGTT